MQGQCTYCLTVGEMTKDHVPPQGIYPKPRPNAMPWVPACRECNTVASKDDEYFRMVMASRGEANRKPAAERIMKPVIRSLNRPEAEGFAAATFDSMNRGNVKTQGGIYLRDQVVMNADVDRLMNVVSRITRGLHFHQFNQTVPLDYEVVSFPLNQGSMAADPPLAQIVAHAAATTPHVVAPDVFTFWLTQADGDDTMSFWGYEFYQTSNFASIVRPKLAGSQTT